MANNRQMTTAKVVDAGGNTTVFDIGDAQAREDIGRAMDEQDGVKSAMTNLRSAIAPLEPTATNKDIGKTLIAKTVTNGKVSEYEFGEAVTVDDTLTQEGQAADAKAVGDAIRAGGDFTAEVKQALYNLVNHIGAWTDGNAQQYIEALHLAMYPPASLLSISAVYTQSGIVYSEDSLEDLRTDLVVTAHYDDGVDENVTEYTLTGVLTAGSSTITVSYGEKTATFTVAVTASLLSISAVYTQSEIIYDTDSLEDLRTDLVVTAHYDNGVAENVTEYTLSGALTAGSSTITVSYEGKTAIFNVTVTAYLPDPYYALSAPKTFTGILADAIDTGVKINEWANREYTIVCEFVGSNTAGYEGQRSVFSSVQNVSPWFGITAGIVNNTVTLFHGNGDTLTSVTSDGTIPIKLVVRHEINATVTKFSLYTSNRRYDYSVNTKNNVSNTVTLKIGRHGQAAQDWTVFIGTISDFKVYKDFLFTDKQVREYLGG